MSHASLSGPLDAASPVALLEGVDARIHGFAVSVILVPHDLIFFSAPRMELQVERQTTELTRSA